jgi:transposase
MALKRRQFTRDFKLQVVREVDAGKPMAQVARQHQLNPNTVAKWRKQLRQYPQTAFAGQGRAYTDEARVAELERMVGRLTMENDLLKKALALLDEQASAKTGNGSSK